MPKVVYANLVWFLIVMGGTIAASFGRHESEIWDSMADVRLNYDLIFVETFGSLFVVALIGLIKMKKWGYEFAMSFNYILVALAFIPVAGLVIFSLKNDIPLSQLAEIDWASNIDNAIISVVSIVFLILMRRPHVTSAF